MTFSDYTQRSVSSPRILLEIDISSINIQWVNAGAGIWYVNFDGLYPEVDSSLLDGFTSQDFLNIGSVRCDTASMGKVNSILDLTIPNNFYIDNTNHELWICLPNYDSPYIHSVYLGVVSGFSKQSFTPIGLNQLYDGRLMSAPSVGYKRDPLFFGRVSYDSVTVDLINADGEFDSFADTENIYGNAARVLFGYAELDYSEYVLVYSGYIENITISETTTSIQIVDKRKQLSKKVYYTCEDRNALDVLYDLLVLVYPSIQYNDNFFNTTEWDAAKALCNNLTIAMRADQTEPVSSLIESICVSVFGIFIIQPDELFSFKIIDTSASATTTIQKADMLNQLSVSYAPDQVLSSVRVSYNRVISEASNDYKTWLTDSSEESAVYAKYKTYITHDFDTYLITQVDAQAYATKMIAYYKDVHGILSLRVPMRYYNVPFAGVVDAVLDRPYATMLGTKKCEILGKTYNLESENIELDLRIV